MVKKWRKIPVVVEAIQFDGWNWAECYQFMSEETLIFPQWLKEYESINIDTLEGTMKCTKGDYIIKGVNGEFYPCKPDIFEVTYNPVEPSGEGGKAKVWSDGVIHRTYHIVCGRCRTNGPYCETSDQATQAWNRAMGCPIK